LALVFSFAVGVLQTMVNVPMTVLVQAKVPGFERGKLLTWLIGEIGFDLRFYLILRRRSNNSVDWLTVTED
jgi:hypothetical protein